MRTRFTILVATLVTFAAMAGPEQIIKQRAKDTANQNNARQGAAPPGGQPPASGAPPQAARPLPPDPVAKVRADLAAIVTASKVTPEKQAEFGVNLLALARGSTKPTSASVNKFASALAESLAGKKLDTSTQSRLVQNLNLLLNSAGLSDSRTQEVAGEVQKTLQSAGVVEATTTTLMSGLDAVVAEVRAK